MLVQCTNAYGDFFRNVERTSNFVTLIMALVNRFGIMRETGTTPPLDLALYEERLAENPDMRPLLEGIDERLDLVWDAFTTNTTQEQWKRMVLEVHISRNVDAFNAYLIRVLTHVFMNNPTLLNEKDVEKISLVSGDEKDRVIERLADDLIGRGLRGVLKYLVDNMNFAFDVDTIEFKEADEYIAVRNVNIHHGGRIDQRFVRRTGQTDLQIGELFPLTVDYATKQAINFLTVIGQLDAELIKQFDLLPEEQVNCAPLTRLRGKSPSPD